MGLVDVQLTSHYKFSRPIPERGAKGLVRETPENLKIEQWTDFGPGSQPNKVGS